MHNILANQQQDSSKKYTNSYEVVQSAQHQQIKDTEERSPNQPKTTQERDTEMHCSFKHLPYCKEHREKHDPYKHPAVTT